MKAPADVCVIGCGAVTPVGLSAPATCAALRAGISAMKSLETRKVDGDAFATVPVTGGRAPTEWFAGGPVEVWEWPGHERFAQDPPPRPETLVEPDHRRLIALALPAAREAFDAACPETATRPARVGLYVGLDRHEPEEAIDAVLRALAEALPAPPVPCRAFASGRAAALLALEAALEDLSAGAIDAALVGGVDSLVRTPVLERLAADRAIKTRAQPDGIVPGEAAAFVLLESAARARARAAPAMARLLSVGRGEEKTAGTEEPNPGTGLTMALRSAVDDAGGLDAPPYTVCDLNGDRYRAMEWGMAGIRVLGHLSGELPLQHPADCIGDPGAGSGALGLVWAATALWKGHAGCERALVWGASEGPERAAAVLAAADAAPAPSSAAPTPPSAAPTPPSEEG